MLQIRTLTQKELPLLSQLLIDTVAAGGSVGFMHPVTEDEATRFWTRSLEMAKEGKRFVLGAFYDNRLSGTVTLIIDLPPNQPHRAEIAKMMTSPEFRGRGVARALLQEAEQIAIREKRWLLVLDTAEYEGASGFYEKQGYQRVGVIPEFALKPHGGLTGTILYFKKLRT